MKGIRYVIIAILLLCAMAGIATAVDVTESINYQGKLTDSSGNPLTGTYSITFKLYMVPSGGTALDTITQSVTCTNGIFNTNLLFDDYRAFNGQPLWLGITVNSNWNEMEPRQEIRPVPYALSLHPGSFIKVTEQTEWGAYALHLINENVGAGGGMTSYVKGNDQDGIYVFVGGTNSRGIKIATDYTATGCYALDINTTTSSSPGIFTETWGVNSQGFAANLHGNSGSHGVDVLTHGTDSFGVKAVSLLSHAIYADTGDATKYGVYTPDRMYASAYNSPTSDVAEYMPVTEDVTPGTVMIIGEDGKLAESSTAYDTRVAGIVSTEPGVTLGTKDTGNPGEEQIAVAGRVPCKVDATKAPIHAGDLLTTSEMPGYAMKAEPEIINGRKFYPGGTVLGKAMGTLESGTGVIEVLVTLQ